MFNNKFGTGVLKHPGYNIDGGIGEAALMGALVGGGASLLTGKNPLTGALMGGLTGGAMSGISGALANTGVNTAVENQIVTGAAENQVLPSLVQAGDPALADLGSFAKSPYGIDLAQGTAGIDTAASQGIGQLYNANAPSMMSNLATTNGYVPDASYVGTTMNPSQAYATAPTATEAANAAAAQAPTAAEAATKTATEAAKSKGILGGVKDWYATAPWYEKAGAGIAGSVALNKLFEDPDMLDPNLGIQKVEHPLADLSPDFKGLSVTPDVYRQNYSGYVRGPGFAEGGIAALAQGGMGNNMGFPQGRLDTTQYATPTQMPTSAQVVNADYEMATDPYTGSPLKMAKGGTTGSQVYYDPEVSKYYTQADNAGFFGSGIGPFGGAFAQMFTGVPGYNEMSSDPNSPFYNGRTYLSGSPMGADTSFQASNPTPEVYDPMYAAQVASNPTTQQTTAPAMPNYSLADSLALLQATNPGIAQQYMQQQQPQQTAQTTPDSLAGTPYPGHGEGTTNAQRAAWNAANAPGLTPGSSEWTAKTGIPEFASGGIAGYNLGGYAAGGNPRLLKGPGDGMSDNIPATIGGKQPARLADGEFVVPADVVSHLGNGSTDAGAKHLYAMMDNVRKARTGKKSQGKQIKPQKFMPA